MYEATVAIRESRAALVEQSRVQSEAARFARQSALAQSGSRLVMAVIIAAGLIGAANSVRGQPSPPTVVANVATHDDVASSERCIRSDFAVYFAGADPDPLCGPPPGRATQGKP